VAAEESLMRGRLLPLMRFVPYLVTGALLLAMVLTVPAFGRASYWLELSRQHFAMAALALALTPIISPAASTCRSARPRCWSAW